MPILLVRFILVILFISFVLSQKITLVSAQVANSQILFFDDFTNNLDKWRVKQGNWYLNQEMLVNKQYGVIDQPSRIEAGDANWKNFRLDADLNNLDGIDSGIGFRVDSIAKCNYELTMRHGSGEHGSGELSTPQVFLQKVCWNQPYNNIKSSKILRDNRTYPLLHNNWYHIRIEVFDNTIKVWINNEQLFNVVDDENEITSGFITLATWTGKSGKIYVSFDNVKVTALGPQPFLDLPWDYKAQGSTFDYMALNPYSWFDHQYPLQNECCNWQVMTYTGETIQRPYRSHNGYDYSRQNGIILNTPVLAAASGVATFKPWAKSGGAGNVIKIDHGNGYQTWYEHLSGDDLIVSTEGQQVNVQQGQQIGKVGMTGNTDGPHIHFSVFKDSNDNNSFNDEVPYGVTDPLGWDGGITDPWSIWSNGTRSGTTSYNLFFPASFTKSINIPVGGGVLNTDDTTISVPAGAYNGSFELIHKIGPFVSLSDYITGITPSFSLNAYSNGQPINQFSKPITITINYSKANLINIKNENTIKFRYFNEQSKAWEELPTITNTVNKTITTEVNHFSRFAVTGEIKDLTAPTTTLTLIGEKGEDGWYRTPLEVKLLGNDNSDGVGLEYILYTLNGEDWFEYTKPLVFDTEGDYQITYQSYDRAENQEQRKTLNFHIDKTPPSVTLDANPKSLWSPNGKMVNIKIVGSASDENYRGTTFRVLDEYGLIQPTITDFNQTIQLEASRAGKDLDGRTYTIEATSTDQAGNIATSSAKVIVPHDQRKK